MNRFLSQACFLFMLCFLGFLVYREANPEPPIRVRIVEQYTWKGQWVALYQDGIWRTEDDAGNLIPLEAAEVFEITRAVQRYKERLKRAEEMPVVPQPQPPGEPTPLI